MSTIQVAKEVSIAKPVVFICPTVTYISKFKNNFPFKLRIVISWNAPSYLSTPADTLVIPSHQALTLLKTLTRLGLPADVDTVIGTATIFNFETGTLIQTIPLTFKALFAFGSALPNLLPVKTRLCEAFTTGTPPAFPTTLFSDAFSS